MIDEHDVRESLRRRADSVPAAPTDARGTVRRARRRLLSNGVVVSVAIMAIAWVALARLEVASTTVPADPTKDLGIFTPFAGRILTDNSDPNSVDDVEGWVDPEGPVDTKQGPGITEEVASAVVPEGVDGRPVGWSGVGTQLLLLRSDGDSLLPGTTLTILHADGTETPAIAESIFEIGDATMSPDGSQILFEGDGDLDDTQLYTVDSQGRPAPFPIPGAD